MRICHISLVFGGIAEGKPEIPVTGKLVDIAPEGTKTFVGKGKIDFGPYVYRDQCIDALALLDCRFEIQFGKWRGYGVIWDVFWLEVSKQFSTVTCRGIEFRFDVAFVENEIGLSVVEIWLETKDVFPQIIISVFFLYRQRCIDIGRIPVKIELAVLVDRGDQTGFFLFSKGFPDRIVLGSASTARKFYLGAGRDQKYEKQEGKEYSHLA